MSGVLFVIACSFNKNGGGETTYDKSKSIASAIKPDLAEKLLKRRDEVREIVKGGSMSWQDKPLSEHPYNDSLVRGPDLNGSKKSSYLSAMDRYCGRFYAALSSEVRQHCMAENSTLIVSGLYGLVLGGEPIQNYSCPLSGDAAKAWKQDSLLTSIVCDYVKKNEIVCVVNLTSMQAYSRLIDWSEVPAMVLHCFDKTGAGDQALMPFGDVFQKFCTMSAEEILEVSGRRAPQAEWMGTCLISQSEDTPDGYPYEVTKKPEATQAATRGEVVSSDDSAAAGTNGQFYAVEGEKQFYRDFDRQRKTERNKILKAVFEIQRAPTYSPSKNLIKRLEGYEGLWRYRIGQYRLVYEVNETKPVVRLIGFGPHDDIYNRLKSYRSKKK